MSMKALERHLQPLMPYLLTDGVTEICINRPGELFVEKSGQFYRYDVPELEYRFLESLAGLVAEFNSKDFPTPLVSGSLPMGERVQFVMPPSCEKGHIVGSIRRHQRRDLTLEEYEQSGAFLGSINKTRVDHSLKKYYQDQNIPAFIKYAIQTRKNILICGGTGTGKTTFLNACLKYVPLHERLITVEDAREVSIPHSNAAHLLFNEDDKQITSLNIFKACLRLRPDRIFLSELRGSEVWPFLRAANSGHPGSLSTLHSDSPEGAFTQLVFMMQQAGSTSTEEQLRQYIKSIIHVVIQLKRNPEFFVRVDNIWFA